MELNHITVEMGKRIIALRKKQQLSQEELAEKADMSQRVNSTAERGVKAVRPENLLRISIALGVSTDYLLTGECVDKDYSLVADKLSKLPPKYLPLVEGVIDECVSLEDRENK